MNVSLSALSFSFCFTITDKFTWPRRNIGFHWAVKEQHLESLAIDGETHVKNLSEKRSIRMLKLIDVGVR